MSNHGHEESQHGSGRYDPPPPRSEISGPTGGTLEDLRRSVVALRRRVLRLSDDLRLAIRRADEAADRNREHVCSLESLEMMCATQGGEIGRYRAEIHRLREERDALQSSLESDRIIGLEPPQPAPEISALETQIVDLNRDLDRQSDEVHHRQAHIDDLSRDRGHLESTIRHLTSEMTQAGGEILDLQQANHDLDRSREDAESTLSATEESMRRTRSELDRVETELILSRSDRADRGPSGPDPQSSQADPQLMGPTQAGLDQIVRERDSQQDQIPQKAYAERERTITENQAQIRTLSRDLSKVVRERDALRHEYTAAFQRLTSISATIGAPPPQTQLRLEPGSDTDQPAGGIPRSPSAETSGSEDQDADTSKSKRSRSRSTSPSPSRPQKKRSVPVEADDESMDEEDESEFDLGGGSTGGGSPSPDQASTPPAKDSGPRQSSGEVIEVRSGSDEEEEEENAEVADDLYEAQTLMAISQSRSEARRGEHVSPQRGSSGSPGGSDGSDSDTGSGG
ncbi:hypothetical protein PHPALM_28278 [Phytophthora palmivora]|uniref:Uncharacterized protein n=1 Tax=Phytophthora palmivora TaxID=4796 RepID=A0A2P4XAH0_9STRA|nr:hypothetical protein PHPALM_28278 [Phytophthora palmivora]